MFSFRVARGNKVFLDDLYVFHSASPGVTWCSWMTCEFFIPRRPVSQGVLTRLVCFHSASPGVTGCSYKTRVFSFRVARCNRVFLQDLCVFIPHRPV